MTQTVDIAIVGGGTAGWMSALTLARCFATSGPKIALIESPNVPTVGVGESTLPTLARTLTSIGLDEASWMKTVGATYKLGVRFQDWCQSGSTTSRSDFWNPFERVRDPAAVNTWFDAWRGADFVSSCSTAAPLLEQDRVPINPSGTPAAEYAFHVDAVKLASVLQSEATLSGVEHRLDNVVDVSLGPAGIDTITLASGDRVRASLYLDCTGFRSVLLGQALDEPWISYDSCLLTDQAVAIAASYPDDGDQTPLSYTTARALSSGWMWHVPLLDRFGAGYVYSSKHQTADEAEAELRAQLGVTASEAPARHLPATTGRRRRSWVGNCVGVGLASGFVEPLEATGIHFIERAVAWIVEALKCEDAGHYNARMDATYEEVRDLIVMHYLVNDRVDTEFWKATKDIDVPDTLASRLEQWATCPPRAADFERSSVFGAITWASVLAGMGFWGDEISDVAMPATSIVASERTRLLDQSSDHRELLTSRHASRRG